MDSHDLIDAEDDIRKWFRDFYLDVSAWDAVPSAALALKWRQVPYHPASRSQLPSKSGLYAFVLTPKPGLIPPHGFLLYIGKTGDGSSRATLRKRFGQYVLEQNKPDGRPAVRSMLNRWGTHLIFAYATVSDKASIADLEDALIKATYPPINKSIADITARYVAGAAFSR
jgi:hypothetical protein